MKCGIEIIQPLIREIKLSSLDSDQVILICFKAEVIKSFKEKLPQYKAYWLSGFKKDKQGTWKPSIDKVFSTIKNMNLKLLRCTMINLIFIQRIQLLAN